MPDDFVSIKEVFSNNKAFSKVRKAALEYDVKNKFKEIFPEFKKFVKAVKIENGYLFLRVENSVLRNEISINQKLMIDKINKYFNSKILKAVKFIP